MDKLKPIEAGCLALIYNSECGNDGAVVTCLKYIGEMDDSWETDLWETDTLLKSYYFDEHGNREGRAPDDCFVPESNLMRIDGGEFEEETEEAHFVSIDKYIK
ncbi:MAG: hypothetical protein COA78_12095 [Blastopirellula sp.]|nr:MAG: hypothetical protein COA78_12095 [Blastopirellula sp.]